MTGRNISFKQTCFSESTGDSCERKCSEARLRSVKDLLELQAIGNFNRTQHLTDVNAESSRSYVIFQAHNLMKDTKTGEKRIVKLSIIDLADSERAGSTKGLRLRFKEGANINKSLLTLGNFMNNLANGLKHIPYSDSKLTRILKDSLGEENDCLKRANTALKLKNSKCSNLDENDYRQWCHRIDIVFTELAKAQEKQIYLKSQIKVSELCDEIKTILKGFLESFPIVCNAQKNCLAYLSSASNLNQEINTKTDEILD
uniref:Kinesin motor domain-containing protein n=1 Tax=Glossina brevipalpis TaxID=37001 RepID=A0A1A9WBJ8_9MUSC